jgi:hypothetical protein
MLTMGHQPTSQPDVIPQEKGTNCHVFEVAILL